MCFSVLGWVSVRRWETVARREIERHYDKQRAQGTEVRRQQIMMIWSFKRKRHPDGTL